MERIKKITVIALFVGCQAAVCQFLDNQIHGFLPGGELGGFSCVAFLGWPTYFMSGCTLKDGIRAFFAFIVGIVAGIVIIQISGWLGFMGAWGNLLAVLVVAWLLFYYELGPEYLNHLAACYISCGSFFFYMTHVAPHAQGMGATMTGGFITILVYLTIGLIFGWMTIAFRTWYEGRNANPEQA
ncbi:MAG: DUF1097 domain-containing protein [Atopobiaceae bacterium]|nr:DUF1097 domain-containing protein [Atopobiaceae bacterium]